MGRVRVDLNFQNPILSAPEQTDKAPRNVKHCVLHLLVFKGTGRERMCTESQEHCGHLLSYRQVTRLY